MLLFGIVSVDSADRTPRQCRIIFLDLRLCVGVEDDRYLRDLSAPSASSKMLVQVWFLDLNATWRTPNLGLAIHPIQMKG